MDEAGWNRLLSRLESLGRRAAIVGPHGSGKTTLLEDLGARLEAQGWRVQYLRLHADRRSLPSLPKVDDRVFLLCDGAEQLRILDWIRLRWCAARAGGLAITTHRAGRLPTLHRCETTPALLREVAGSLGATLTEVESTMLWVRHAGNLRDVIRELYDRWSDVPALT